MLQTSLLNHVPLAFVMLLFLLTLLHFQLPFLWFTLKCWYSAQFFSFSLCSFCTYVVSFHPHVCSFDATCMPMIPKPLISSSDPIHASPETYLLWLLSKPDHQVLPIPVAVITSLPVIQTRSCHLLLTFHV